MAIKTIINNSPNFNPKKRNKNQIKFLIFHYTGMRTEKAAIKKLTDIKSKVSSHYLVKQNGDIIALVPDSYIAWHAGKSVWKNYDSLNKYSIGIEISNPGHKHGYQNFSIRQIKSLVKLSKYLIKKYKIKKNSILGHSDISPERKMDPGEKFPWKNLSKLKLAYWHSLEEKKIRKLRLIKLNKSEEKKFFKNIKKIGYTRIKNSNINYNKILVKSFQRRFRQSLINGIADQECLSISKNLLKS